MWRDRTNLYISYRQSFTHHPAKKPRYLGASNGFSDIPSQSEESRRLITETGGSDEDGDAIIEMDVLPPRWIDVQDEVTEMLAEAAQKSSQLDKLHQKHLLPGFGDEDIKKQDEAAIERLTQDITRSFHACQKAVQRIEIMVRDAKQQGGVSSGDETMAKNLQISLAARVQEASARFRKKQSNYLKKLRGLEGSSSFDRSPTPMQNPFTDPSLMESDADKSFSQSTLMQTSQRLSTSSDAAIVQREREINDIAKGIIELSDIFRELQAMVIDQGTMLDRIDYNIERMGTEVKAADKELKVATNYQRRTVKRKILLLLIILVAGLFIVLLVKPKRHDSPAPSSPAPEPLSAPHFQQSPGLRSRASSSSYRKMRRPFLSMVPRDKWVDPDIYR
ncbi:t-SNARE syntaxin TLG2 [Aspergillus saccharolyticus JOP 1030-1]|uniref:SNARE complex subunit n=1 Tax=Aspergillus saccharolyticus JOP 1030-1 TaxID=1450539 RepID=A0A318Z7M6_9EURO|nr:SNARE complex subunit [Aspergillus saccharolyticus JOP 1030-1]PYH40773.1 SNARE complex subunit [Aspergillus saccharolyticus JOP 1030-1]